ncbi:ATP-binding protein [Ramlibacter sp. 2FC]|uniref:sensor histidine kinase n=1 Tax=Ramlibacter sp. 2FC TaxID=2502188 RepID=UPI00201D79AF|nr:ATP-binding protein [Ramlibacter sp. 2FC]
MTSTTRGAGAASWLSPLAQDRMSALYADPPAFRRLWHGFMTARVAIAAVLLLLQGTIYVLGRAVPGWLVGLCLLYLGATLLVRLLARPQPPGPRFDPQWASTIAVDVVAFSVLQFLLAGGITYTPLFALPVLLASVMGSAALALGSTAAVTLLLLADAWWQSAAAQYADTATRFLQAGLAGSGLFIVAFLTNQLASRLVREERASRRNRLEARAQTLVNELVIDSLTDGVLVIDSQNVVRAANPSARQMLGRNGPAKHPPFSLGDEAAWGPLSELAQLSLASAHAQTAELSISHTGLPRRRLHARTRLTAPLHNPSGGLCVVFLQDLREMEARLRTEKLAAMGRMSTAVAHEIRNPLAAITQANALLDEDLSQPAHRQLTAMVQQNAQRLAQIVDDILDVARVEPQGGGAQAVSTPLDETTATACEEWMQQNACSERITLELQAAGTQVAFAPDHLRRVLINLLDNALRYAGPGRGAIQVGTEARAGGDVRLRVWSDGVPLEPAVQRHLFEPFFSSESRSSGLGLFICRELCERHGAAIGYERTRRRRPDGSAQGNEFFVSFRRAGAAADASARPRQDRAPARP